MYNQSDIIMTPKPSAKLLSQAAQQMGRVGGSRNTAAQKAARVQNARRAGRPGRICNTCGRLIQHAAMASHDKCGLWTWRTPAERRIGAS